MKKGVLRRVKALLKGKFVCRIYDKNGLLHEDFNFMHSVQVLDRFRKAFPGRKYVLKLEEF